MGSGIFFNSILYTFWGEGGMGGDSGKGKREVVRMGSMVVLLDFLIFTCGLSGSRMCVAFNSRLFTLTC